jgi:phage replication-related protein YjqB (UPF0714/DUF867 family)
VADKYRNFAELKQTETIGRDFRIRFRDRDTDTLVIAPHDGAIEPGTSEIADAIAGDDLSFYAFEGIKTRANRNLHITCVHFDEPRCVRLVEASQRTISIHGEASRQRVVYLGGRDLRTLKALAAALESKGFVAKAHQSPHLQGRHKQNICNRTATGMGVQLELSAGLRRSFFQGLSKQGRRHKTPRFHDFVAAVHTLVWPDSSEC